MLLHPGTQLPAIPDLLPCKDMPCLHPLPTGLPRSPRSFHGCGNWGQIIERIHPVPLRLREEQSPKPGRPLQGA